MSLDEALADLHPDVLAPAPDEHLELGTPTAELFLGDLARATGPLLNRFRSVRTTPKCCQKRSSRVQRDGAGLETCSA